MPLNRLLAEALGTFTLLFAGTGAIVINGVSGGTTVSVFGNDTLNQQSFVPADVVVSLVANGGLQGVTISAAGVVTVPAGTTGGTYVITYSICEAAFANNCDTTTVTVLVDSQPIALVDFYTTPSGTPISNNVAGNDTAMLDGPVVFSLLIPPAAGTGTLVFNADGSFTFTPAAGFSGPVNFTYQICDVDGDCSAATATIVVGTADVAPVAQPDTYETAINTPVSGSLTVNDSGLDNGPVVYAVVTPPGTGTAVVNPNGTFTYTPATGFTGVVTFTYQVCEVDGD